MSHDREPPTSSISAKTKEKVQTKVRTQVQKVAHWRDGKAILQSIPKRGRVFDTCASKDDRYRCCNVKVIKTVSNCPFDCSYCFLQNYLTNGVTQVIEDIDAVMDEVVSEISKSPERLFRIGSWELGDSLALERETGQAATLISAFSKIPNALLELKTKSDCVESILDLEHHGRTVISFSLNTETVVQAEEHKTASLQKRLKAAQAVAKAGYLIGLHFDPMILYEGWEPEYMGLVDQVFSVLTHDQIAWISMGSLRFNPEMALKLNVHFPGSRLGQTEMVAGDDHKVRYVKPTRVKMYQRMFEAIRVYAPDVLLYLCMERWDVWERVMGNSPDSISHLDYQFACSVTSRFPHLALPKPRWEDYDGAEF